MTYGLLKQIFHHYTSSLQVSPTGEASVLIEIDWCIKPTAEREPFPCWWGSQWQCSGVKGSCYHIVPNSVPLFYKDRRVTGWYITWQGQLLPDSVQDRKKDGYGDKLMIGWIYGKIFQGLSICVRALVTTDVSAGCNTASLTNTLTWSQTQQLPDAQCNCLLAAWAAGAQLKSGGVTEHVNMYCMSKKAEARNILYTIVCASSIWFTLSALFFLWKSTSCFQWFFSSDR